MVFEEQRENYARYLQDAMREIREEAGMSQGDLAEKLSCGMQTLHRYETGKSIPSADFVFLFAAVMGVPLERLCPDHKTSTSLLEEQTRFSLLSQENKKVVIATMNSLVNSLINAQYNKS